MPGAHNAGVVAPYVMSDGVFANCQLQGNRLLESTDVHNAVFISTSKGMSAVKWLVRAGLPGKWRRQLSFLWTSIAPGSCCDEHRVPMAEYKPHYGERSGPPIGA